MIRAVALVLTLLTGFSGLVYEVAWQKYLATLLGSHSEATSAVLAIFLGGLSVGYWLFGVVTRRVVTRAEAAGQPPRLLLLYGVIEGSIGLYVIAFPWLFSGVQVLSYSIPHGPGGIGFAIDVVLAAILIGPASVLMGGTIPILTQGLARSLDDATRFHAFVYAFNTIGAFAGALAAGFYLVPTLGLVNLMYAMGCINLFAGGIFIAVGLRGRAVVSLEQAGEDEGGEPEGFGAYAAVALLTGFAMMAIQTTIIRMAGLSFGSSQFTFSLVVAVFVLCIALGSFAVSALSRIPTWVVIANQWALAGFFLVLYPQLENAPYWVHVLRTLFRDNAEAFPVYYGLGFVVVLAVIGPAVMLSGAALPLLFHHMRREVGHLGDLAGNLYSWNTVGSLLGALLGGYLLLFWLDLHHVYRLAVVALLGAALLLSMRILGWRPVVGAAFVPLAIAVMLLPAWSPERMYAGLFRSREPMTGTYAGPDEFVAQNPGRFKPEMIFHTDDPIVSVSVVQYPLPDGPGHSLSIVTNGKGDGNTVLDYTTMGLAATLPALLAEEAKSAFVIGWGTGITAGELASLDTMERVDVAEISPGVIATAPLFDFASLDASKNPKVHIIESDAYRALMRLEQRYDIIVSEPSNPWVTGVEMLFSKEFLSAARDRLSDGGVYAQWYHQYETDGATVEMVLRTYREVFDHIAVWAATPADMLLIGFQAEGSGIDHFRLLERAERPDFKRSLERARVMSGPELLAHELLPLGVIHATEMPGEIHTLYHPRLNDLAGRAFYRGARGELPFTAARAAAEIGARNSMLGSYARLYRDGIPDEQRAAIVRESCRATGVRCETLAAQWLAEGGESAARDATIEWLLATQGNIWEHFGYEAPSRERLERLAGLYARTAITGESDALSAGEVSDLTAEYQGFYLHGAPFNPMALRRAWGSCREGQRSVAECQQIIADRGLDRGGADIGEMIRECQNVRAVSRDCADGLADVRALLDIDE